MNVLAQINIAQLIAPIDDPLIKDFVDGLDHINALAEKSPGYIWRLKDEENNATSFNPYNDESIIVNISVWQDIEHLKAFVYNSDHINYFRRRKEWFKPMQQAHMALWLTPISKMPTAIEGKKRLDHLWKNGPSQFSFDYKTYQKFV